MLLCAEGAGGKPDSLRSIYDHVAEEWKEGETYRNYRQYNQSPEKVPATHHFHTEHPETQTHTEPPHRANHTQPKLLQITHTTDAA